MNIEKFYMEGKNIREAGGGIEEFIARWNDLTGGACPSEDYDFFAMERGFDGLRCPERREGWRFGKPGKFSMNFRDERRESGASMMALENWEAEDITLAARLYAACNGDQEIYWCEGWFCGGRGSDGEPLLWVERSEKLGATDPRMARIQGILEQIRIGY